MSLMSAVITREKIANMPIGTLLWPVKKKGGVVYCHYLYVVGIDSSFIESNPECFEVVDGVFFK